MFIPKKAPNAYLFFFKEKRWHNSRAIDFISNITIDGLKFVYKGDENRKPANFIISNREVKTVNKVDRRYKNNDLKSNSKINSDSRGKIIENIKEGEPTNKRTSLNMDLVVPAVLILGVTVYGVRKLMA